MRTTKKPSIPRDTEPLIAYIAELLPQSVSKKVYSWSSMSRSLFGPRTHLHACRGYRIVFANYRVFAQTLADTTYSRWLKENTHLGHNSSACQYVQYLGTQRSVYPGLDYLSMGPNVTSVLLC